MNLKPCPFCHHTPIDLLDAVHPLNQGWRDDDGIRHYSRYNDPQESHGQCWSITCLPHEGGCGATMRGDSEEEVIAAWNRRPDVDPQLIVSYSYIPDVWCVQEVYGKDKVVLSENWYDLNINPTIKLPAHGSKVPKRKYIHIATDHEASLIKYHVTPFAKLDRNVFISTLQVINDKY